MDIIDISIFLAIAETNSISRAAELMHFSQSTISYRLKNLEKEIGAPLFFRNRGNKTELTLYGEHFIPVAKRWQTVWQDTQTIKLLPSNALVVATVDSINTAILPNVYQAVSNGETPIKLRIMTHQSPEIYDLLEDQIADIGFVGIEQTRKNIETICTFRNKYYVVRYSDHPTAPRRVKPEELDPTFEIHHNWGSDFEQWHESLWGALTKYHVWLDTLSLLQYFLTDERYWTILTGPSLNLLLKTVRSVQIDELDTSAEVYRICYVIQNKKPKPSSIESLELFKSALMQHLHSQSDFSELV